MTKTLTAPKKLIALFCTTAILAALPLSFDLDAKTGALGLKASVALADNDGGNDGHDNGGNDGHDNGGHDNGGNGNGGNDGHDNGGNGGHDNGGNDNGGHDNGGNDNGGHDNGSHDNGSYDSGIDSNNDGFDDATGTPLIAGNTNPLVGN